MFSKEYLFTIHHLFVISNNILAQSLEFGSFFFRGGVGHSNWTGHGVDFHGGGEGIQPPRIFSHILDFMGGVRASKGGTM